MGCGVWGVGLEVWGLGSRVLGKRVWTYPGLISHFLWSESGTCKSGRLKK